MSKSFAQRVSATVAVAALAVLAGLTAAVPASAAPGNIDPSIPRSLTVHKYQLGPTSPQQGGTGQLIPGGIPNGVPIEGVTFTATLLPNINLETAAGWTAASSLTPQNAASQATGAQFTATTDNTGTATFTSTSNAQMPIGVYLVRETAAPAEVTDPTAPFLVTLPYPTGALGSPANEWIYDVHVYPKNSVTKLVKTRIVPPTGSVEARNPDLVRWAIRADVPTIAAGGSLSNFSVTDTLPATGMQFVTTPPTGVAPTSVIVRTAAGAVVAFTAGTDYTLATTGQSTTVTFTAEGRTRLLAQASAGQVELNVLTRATSTPLDGQLTNTASSTVNGSTETTSAVTPIGEFTLFAYAPAAGGGKTPLAGATYQLFLNETDANAGTNPISINGVDRWTTNADGIAYITGVTPGTYWGREIEPPAGFQPPRLTTPATVVAGTTSTTAPIQNYLEVPHTQLSAWALPLTGGDGALWFGVGGVALVAMGVGAAILVARRRREAGAPVA